MTRILVTAGILAGLSFSIVCAAHSGPQRNLASDNGCFPWQDFRKGKCVTKESPTSPPPLPEQPAAEPVPAPPPAAVAPAPSAPPYVPAPALSSSPPSETITRRPEVTVVCDGGSVVNGACTCPSGYRVLPASSGEAGGACVRNNAESCLGGELTVSGKCLCSGQVTMSGETYLLEYSRGKCLPMRCPVTELKEGKCTTSPTLQSTEEAEPKKRPAPTRAESEPRRRCGRGMVQTRSGCVAAHRRWDDYYGDYY